MSLDTAPHYSAFRVPGSWPDIIERNEPVDRVIYTVELCEQILEHLTCIDLSRARCVCRQFDAVIKQSTLMQQNLFLRPRLGQILWAAPSRDILLTGKHVEEHIATAKANGHLSLEFVVYEMHPYLTIDHNSVSEIGHRTGERDPRTGWLLLGSHSFSFSDLCLTSIPDDFPLDDVYICQPPVKDITAAMCYTHDDDTFTNISNDNGITFGDIRKAVKNYLLDLFYVLNKPWKPCSEPFTVIRHTSWHRRRWTTRGRDGKTFNYALILFDLIGCSLATGLLFSDSTESTSSTLEMVLCAALCTWLMVFLAHLPMAPTAIVSVKRCDKVTKPCGHELCIHEGVPVSTEERIAMEEIGIVTDANDPYHAARKAALNRA
jgi:hypothetical protein